MTYGTIIKDLLHNTNNSNLDELMEALVRVVTTIAVLSFWLHSNRLFAAATNRFAEASVAFSLITDTISQCDTGLTNGGIYAVLEYRLLDIASPHWQRLDVISIPASQRNQCPHQFNSSFQFQRPPVDSAVKGDGEGEGPQVQFRLVQWEHGGGYCNCWGVLSDTWNVQVEGITLQLQGLQTCDHTGTITDLDTDCRNDSLSFCSGSASVPRGFLSEVLDLNTARVASEPCPTGQLGAVIEPMGPSLSRDCSNSKAKIVISFVLKFLSTSKCDVPDGAEKGVELAVGNWNNDGYWIPLVYYHQSYSRREEIRIGEFTEDDQSEVLLRLRGYDVVAKVVENLENDTLELCDPKYLGRGNIQFRWLETSRHPHTNVPPVDVWTLDDVSIELRTADVRESLVSDDLDSSTKLDGRVWNQNVRNGNVTGSGSIDCGDGAESGNGNFLFFSTTTSIKSREDQSKNIVSRLVSTATLDLGGAVSKPTTSPPTTSDTTTPLTTSGSNFLEDTLGDFLDVIGATIGNFPVLQLLEDLDVDSAVELLANLTSTSVQSELEEVDPVVFVFLLSNLLNRTQPPPPPLKTLPPQIANEIDDFSQSFVRVMDNIVAGNPDRVEVQDDDERLDNAILGGSILSIMEEFALNTFSADEGDFQAGNIMLSTSRVQVDMDDDRPASTFAPQREYTLTVPRQLLLKFMNESADEEGKVRMVSHLFSNMQGVIPGDTPDTPGTELASGIVSMAIQCDTETCETGDAELTEPVVITIAHSSDVEERMTQDNESGTTCVFWDFLETANGLTIGQWSDEGCFRNKALSNNSVTVCECFHLTHFAILLSAAPLNTSAAVTLSLEIIGYVGVSVSLVAMAITVFTFLLLKPLRTMRNFVHINLCISLGIAQIIFVAAVDTASGSDDDVLTHCQAVAVLLHYFFLVSFMWMLMEGVVLYVALVRVFVKRKKLYMLAFAVASYGVPLLYLGALTLPLGFALQTQPNYGYSTACFLNPATHFIWAFIVPVVVIIFINFGFFIMAATIMWRHQKKQIDKTRLQNIRNWMRAAVSLVVIMGLTWILGVLIVEVDQLLPLAYIYTILVAFQGLFIFLIFVLLSKQVREAYSKWWRAKVNESDVLSKYFGDGMSSATIITNKSVSKNESTKVPPLSISGLEELSCDLPIVPITPTSLGDDIDVTPSPVRALSKKRWNTIRHHVQEGSLFKVVCSPTYFEPQLTPESAESGTA